MFDFLKRGRLVRRGLASRKTRRRRPRSELARNLEYAPYVKALIFRDYATLDQSTKELFSKLADSSRFWSDPCPTGGHESPAGNL